MLDLLGYAEEYPVALRFLSVDEMFVGILPCLLNAI